MDSIQETDYSIEAAKGVPNSTSETAFIPTTKASQKKKWSFYLIFCCFTVGLSSFQFGYNISSLNSSETLIKQFIKNNSYIFKEFHQKNKSHYETEFSINITTTELFKRLEEVENNVTDKDVDYMRKYNMNLKDFTKCAAEKMKNLKEQHQKEKKELAKGSEWVNYMTDYYFILINCLFFIGGMVGAYKSKRMLDNFGRKKGILIHYVFSLLGSILVYTSPIIRSPVCLGISRFLFGVQGGMSCCLIPIYLSEISPPAQRGRIGIVHQLFITIGILVAQILSFKCILGGPGLWNYLLFMPFFPALIGAFLLLVFFSETPKVLLINNNDEESAKKVLSQLLNKSDVRNEIQELKNEAVSEISLCYYCQEPNQNAIGIFKLLKSKEYKWALITGVIIHLAQQLSGFKAIFFYSSDIFRNAGIHTDHLQYINLSTGLVYIVSTILCFALIDRIGRKSLLVYTIVVIIVNHLILTTILYVQNYFIIDSSVKIILSYMSIICTVLFIILFSIGLGPIPFIYAAEVFGQRARSSGMAICIFTNCASALLLTLCFHIIKSYINQFVFLIFVGVLLICLTIISFKMPETSKKTTDQIRGKFSKDFVPLVQSFSSPRS